MAALLGSSALDGLSSSSSWSLFSPSLSTCLLFLATFLLLLQWRKVQRPRGFPPGPRALPLLGNLGSLPTQEPGTALHKLSKRYGDVYSLLLGRELCVVINGFDAVRDALVNHAKEFAGRPWMAIVSKITQGLGIITAGYNHSWKQQRRFALSTLRNFGLGKKSLEEKINEEVAILVQTFRESGDTFDPHFSINNAVSNIICSIVFGNRFDYDDKRFRNLLHLFAENFRIEGGWRGKICIFMPWLEDWPGPHQLIFRNADKVNLFFQERIREHRQTREAGQPRDLIDAYLDEMEKESQDPESTFTDGNLLNVVGDLFIAGTETSSTTLRWALLYMMAYPQIQERCQREIDEVIGGDRSPNTTDRANLPYTDAVIHEAQRMANVAPLGVLHSTTTDVKFRGYDIPKGTKVLLNLTSVLHDETQWKTPNEFNPDHFLDNTGQFVKPDAFLAFSAGPRVCLGENLARMELFLFFTSLLQRFKFHWPDATSRPNFVAAEGLSRAPVFYKLGVRPRDTAK
ncbi:cytochrome P450 2J4-like [Petromyzon marinus]|uniref:cytochrome P450 2J4-like n=1 Tax=Petromyzon marinus TaxID=7757 RepID=UPI003F712C6D